MNEKEIEQLILNAINMSENPNGKCIHSCDYEELARDIAESLVKKLNLTDVSQQREQLIDFLVKIENTEGVKIPLTAALSAVDEYIKGNL